MKIMLKQLFFVGLIVSSSISISISQRACSDLATSTDRFLHYTEIDLFFDSNGQARHTDHQLDSIVNLFVACHIVAFYYVIMNLVAWAVWPADPWYYF